MRDRTVLVLAASDSYALPSEEPGEDGHLMVQRLHDYLPVFKPGARWGDPDSDICWEKSYFQTNQNHKLFINQVGSREWRPEASYDSLPNVFFAGDCCPTDVDMATVEAAVLSGLNAAQALWTRQPLGPPVDRVEADVHSDAAFLAMKLAVTPYAYWAKWWSTALDAVTHRARGDFSKGIISPATTMLMLPSAYLADWWETTFALWENALFHRKR